MDSSWELESLLAPVRPLAVPLAFPAAILLTSPTTLLLLIDPFLFLISDIKEFNGATSGLEPFVLDTFESLLSTPSLPSVPEDEGEGGGDGRFLIEDRLPSIIAGDNNVGV